MILRTPRVNTHEYIKMILFSLSLQNDTMDWFIKFPANNISTLAQMQNVFMEKVQIVMKKKKFIRKTIRIRK